jgi:hypothetical protein
MKTKFPSIYLSCLAISLSTIIFTQNAVATTESKPDSYEECRQTTIKEFRAKKIDSKQTKTRLQECNQKFPASAEVTKCNEQAIRQNKKDREAMRSAVKQCRELDAIVNFDARKSRPLSLFQDKVWFAGIALESRSYQISELDLPNFNCQAVKNALSSPDTAQYILTGNQLRAFKGFSNISDQALKKIINSKPKKDPATGNIYWSVKGVGRIYRKDKKSDALVFLPSAACSYTGVLHNRLKNLELHMLIDFKRKSATPVYALSFYQPDNTENSSSLLSEVGHIIGATKRNFVEKRGLTVLAQDKFEMDLEGDPQDLCLGSRKNHWIAIAKHIKPSPDQPLSYIVVAKLDNLCEYGDLLSTAKRAHK